MDEEAQKTRASAGGKSAEAQKEETLFDNPGQLLDKLADEAKASQAMTAASPSDVSNINDPFDRINRRAGKSQSTAKPATQPQPAAPVASRGARALAIASMFLWVVAIFAGRLMAYPGMQIFGVKIS